MAGLKLNLGCGRTRLPGYIGVDIYPGGAADVLADAVHLPFRDRVFEEVLAYDVLEHIPDLRAAMKEVHRVMVAGGSLVVQVPFGLTALYDPFHYHAFNFSTLRFFASAESRDLQWERLFDIEDQRITAWRMPFGWHLRKYVPWLHRLLAGRHSELVSESPFPVGPRKKLTARLRKPQDDG